MGNITMNEAFKNLMLFYCIDAPAWAKYAAVDEDGEMYVHSNIVITAKNMNKSGYWIPTKNGINEKMVHQFETPLPVNWKETLIEL